MEYGELLDTRIRSQFFRSPSRSNPLPRLFPSPGFLYVSSRFSLSTSNSYYDLPSVSPKCLSLSLLHFPQSFLKVFSSTTSFFSFFKSIFIVLLSSLPHLIPFGILSYISRLIPVLNQAINLNSILRG